MVVGALGLTLSAVFFVTTCVVVPCACSVFVALLVWRCGLNYSILVVVSIPSLSPPPPPFPPFFFFFPSTPLPSFFCVIWGRGAGGVGGVRGRAGGGGRVGEWRACFKNTRNSVKYEVI